MTEPQVSVIVPTYNRPRLLRLALESILAQDYRDFGVIVLDNASTDDTQQLVQKFMSEDSRVRYVRNPENIGLIRNWNRAFELNRSPFVSIFHDDDIMLSGFLSETVAVLERHPTVGFVLVQVEYIDQDGKPSGVQDVGDLPDGLMSGLDLLELAVDGRHQGIFPPNIVFRASAAAAAGPIESPHTNHQVDLNMYNRVAARHDVFFIRRILAQYRMHVGSETERQKRELTGHTWYGESAERIDAIAYLMRSPRAADEQYRRWLARRLLYLHAHQSNAIHPIIPAMYHSWETRVEMVQEQLEKLIPPGDTVIFVDDGQLGMPSEWRGRRLLPFLERDGQYWGPPETDDQAIADLTRLIGAGVRWIVFAWCSFWWLDRYWRFHRFVEKNYSCRLSTPNIVVHELSAPAPGAK